MGLSIPLVSVLLLFGGSSLYFHFRGRVRFKLKRQLGDYSTLLAPYNALVCLTQRLPRQPVHDLAAFPELAPLRKHWRAIRAEAQALLERGLVQSSPRGDDLVFYSFFKRGWKRFYLEWYRGFLPSAVAACPLTVELLAAIPNVHGAMFALMEPHSKLGKHRDPFAGALRYHLGLVTPNSPQCKVKIDAAEHVWRDGEDVLFDSSYVHGAVNDTDQCRLVLFCDVERPLRYRWATALNRWVMRRLVPGTMTPNVPGERVGVANRAFAAIQPVRRGIAALKQRSAPAYYALKIVAAVGIVVLLALL